MSIRVQIEDESGTPEGATWWHVRSTELLVGEHPGTCCLRFIDPYGDVVFNQLQLPVLLAELHALQAAVPDGELAVVAADLLAYLRAAVDQVHVYVRCVGD